MMLLIPLARRDEGRSRRVLSCSCLYAADVPTRLPMASSIPWPRPDPSARLLPSRGIFLNALAALVPDLDDRSTLDLWALLLYP